MKKRIITLLMAAMLVLSLSGCGNATQGSGSQGSQSTPSVSDNKETNSTAGSTATADFLKTITAETAEAKGVCGADLTWYYKDNVLVIKGTGDMTDYTSNALQRKSKNTTSAPWRELIDDVNMVIIGEGCTGIGASAFYSFDLISSIQFPSTLEKINEYALSGCNNIKEITLPASVTSLGDDAINIGKATAAAPGETVYSATVHYNGSDENFTEFSKQFQNLEWVKTNNIVYQRR